MSCSATATRVAFMINILELCSIPWFLIFSINKICIFDCRCTLYYKQHIYTHIYYTHIYFKWSQIHFWRCNFLPNGNSWMMITFKIHSFTQSVCLQITFPASVSLGHVTNLMNWVLDPSWSLKSCNLKPQYNTTCPVWLTKCYEDQTEKENIYSSALLDEGNATVGEGVWGRRLTFIMLFALSFLIALPDQFSTFLHPDLHSWPLETVTTGLFCPLETERGKKKEAGGIASPAVPRLGGHAPRGRPQPRGASPAARSRKSLSSAFPRFW